MAVTAPPRPSDSPAPAAARPRHRPAAARDRITDHVFRWIALGGRAARARDPRPDRVHARRRTRGRGSETEGFGHLRRQLGPGEGPVRRRGDDLRHVPGRLIALVISVPVSIGIALFVNEVAPRRLRKPIIYTVDLLAAIPSVVYGLWALDVLTPNPLADVYESISVGDVGHPDHRRPHRRSRARPALSYMTAGLIVAIMITPIITSLTREVFATTPASLEGSGVRHGRDALGDDPGRGVPAQPRWCRVGGHDRPRPGHRRDHRGRAAHRQLAAHQRAHLRARATRWPASSPTSSARRPGTQRAALIGMGVVLLVLTVGVGILARGVVARYDRRSGAVA